ncbi:MAG: aminotransferase class I/II-fold pyridoxal phosphate-dependent enzyme [Boseongicola sp.]|nr:MAG: aminotransferase class I/II-fold pyridoxal phosphate-dependent enzyme [Boseongicola sp.]
MAISEETFYLDPGHEGTLQKQIQTMVAEGVLSGRFRPGERLPSSRRLAKHLGVSRITVTLAYSELLADDYLASKGRSGYFISDTAPRPRMPTEPASRDDAVDWPRMIGTRWSQGPKLEKPGDWRRFRYPFIYGQADASLFDHRNWRLCALQALGQRDFAAMTGDYFERDDPKLVEFIARHSLPRRGILATPDQILVTLGAQNALWLAAQILLTQRRMAVVEAPCYPGLRDILQQTRCNVVSLPVDDEGLLVDHVPTEADVVFATPSHHCPTSVTMPVARRQALLERASRDNFLVVEDDYEFEMSFLEPPSPALKSLDREGRVIHIGSFSKSLFPGLRLGYLVGSAPFIREARALRATILRHPPGHVQRTAAYFLSFGHYDALIRRTAKAFKDRRAVMEMAIRENELEIAGGGEGGSSFWMRAPEEVDSRELAHTLAEQGVLIESGTSFFPGENPPRNFYRLAYSSIPSERIPEGIALVAKAIRGE